MHKIHEIPQAQVADRLGISVKTVEKHLRLGLAACRDGSAAARHGHDPALRSGMGRFRWTTPWSAIATR